MKNGNIRQNWGPEEHPPLELLRQYQAGALSPAINHQVERHLLSCDLCSDIAEGMALSTPAKTQAAVQDIQGRLQIFLAKEKHRTPLWYDWRAAAAILVLLCSLGLVIYQQYSNHIKPEKSIAAVQKEVPIGTATPPPLPSQNQNTAPVENVKEPEKTFVPSAPPLAFQRKKSISAVKQDDQKEALPGETSDVLETYDIAGATNAPPEIIFEEKISAVDQNIKLQGSNLLQAEPESLRLSLVKPSVVLERALSGKVAGVQARSISRQVKGKVVASSGEGIPGVTVQVKGSSQAAATDANGEFKLQVPEAKEALVASFIGYQTKEVPLTSKETPLKIELTEDKNSLSEVVVTGYGKVGNSLPNKIITVPAVPEIGWAQYSKYLQQNVRYPANTNQTKTKGRVLVEFTVSTSGTMEDIKIVKGLNPAYNAEAIRLVQEGPAWTPAQHNGNTVEQKVKVVVKFKDK